MANRKTTSEVKKNSVKALGWNFHKSYGRKDYWNVEALMEIPVINHLFINMNLSYYYSS